MNQKVQLQEAFKLALSMALFYWLALSTNWDMPKYGGLAIALVSLGTAGASLHKSVMRLVGTTAGLGIGILGLALFAQDRGLTLLFFGAHAVGIAYFMQASRNGYAWFVAGFLPSLVWATTYGRVDHAFDYATYRYLETSAGIIIYSLVTALLWPRRAGDQLGPQGQDLLAGLRALLGAYRRRLTGGEASPEAADLPSKLAGAWAQMLATVDAARADTRSVAARKPAWEALMANVRAFGDALVLWRQTIEDSRGLDLDRLLPGHAAVLDAVDRRLERIGGLWRARSGGGDVKGSGSDAVLLEPLALKADDAAAAELAHFDRATLLTFMQQLDQLDLTSRELLRTMRVLAGLDPVRSLNRRSPPRGLDRPALWDPERLIKALFPALCLAVGFVLWIYLDPPGGPSVPNLALTFGLTLLLTPMPALAVVPVFLAVLCLALAPLYFLVMPGLDSGLGLLAMIFGYTFLFGYLGGRRPVVKAVALPMLVMMTGISNDQVYSFTGFVNGGIMLLLALGIVGVMQMLLSPMRPEQVLIRSVGRFWRGCARIVGGFAPGRSEAPGRGRGLRRRYYESMVRPVPQRLRAVAKRLDDDAFPDDTPQKMRRLLDALESVSLRLRALELAHDRLVRSGGFTEALAAPVRQLRERVQHVCADWARLRLVSRPDDRAALAALSRSVEEALDATLKRGGPDRLSDQVLTDVYSALGCARGLVVAMAEAGNAMTGINWDRWAEARF